VSPIDVTAKAAVVPGGGRGLGLAYARALAAVGARVVVNDITVLFGSDYPVLTPDRRLADFEKFPIKDEVRPKILKEDAARLLGLTP
jgi:NAD(P)-dependent dehydrogenase (short-subunit alcohol dehydrogenase family)